MPLTREDGVCCFLYRVHKSDTGTRGPKVSKIIPSRIFNTSSLPKLVVALRVPFFFDHFTQTLVKIDEL